MWESHRWVLRSHFYLWAVLAKNMGAKANQWTLLKHQLRQSQGTPFYLVLFQEISASLTLLTGKKATEG